MYAGSLVATLLGEAAWLLRPLASPPANDSEHPCCPSPGVAQ
jgi:hypothetical protein